METWQLLLVGLLAYWAAVSWAQSRGLLPSFVHTSGPITTLHTKRGKRFLDWMATPKRLWRAWGNFGLGLASVVLVGVLIALVLVAITTLLNPPEPTSISQPSNVLVIPGVNDFLPLSVAPEIIAGLFIGIVIHEFGHGLMCRVEGIDVESMGVALLAVLPVGAFVEPDQDSQADADRGSKSRMFAAGVTNNFLVVVVTLALLFGPVAGAVAVSDGGLVGEVHDGTAAAAAGFSGGDRITAVGGAPVANNTAFRQALDEYDDPTVPVTLASNETVRVERQLSVVANASNSPLSITTNDTITAVNGTTVSTESELRAALADREVAAFELNDGAATATGPAGALVTTIPDAPAAMDGLSAGTNAVVVSVNGTRVPTYDALSGELDARDPGDTISVGAYVNGSRTTTEITLGEQSDGSSYMGIAPARGVSGVAVDGFGATLYPADTYRGLLSGETSGSAYLSTLFGGADDPITGFLQAVVIALYLPLIGLVDPTLGFNFAGIAGMNASFYHVTGVLGVFPDWVTFGAANVLLWTGWVNLNLALFNCIPAFPLDGGHLLRSAAEAVTVRLPFESPETATRAITTGIGLLMLCSLLLMLFGPELLS
ncbi:MULTISPECIES: site-2 protease family protein [Halobacterium]|uniref:site-2 protease family protein n=1 Tax=Halobacterium TaxID=2239 RepID=UPI001966864D|nr:MULTISPECIES: site-2 protease family protein [Halobacterium]MCF2239625.1 site-2 protease family protein [Halobacterium salinarum]MDL0134937.1 site-2 protease family protein [Halobacterium salinarum]MDL0139833.1 site-2 protease family protein [Halobacterium salinarum]QRY22244.1 site-2 protease family protein [Halobacterium sp. GSL-19]QRY24322.1 site-2 protease family protein [Halobacterium sp. BOL4-2]